MTIRPIDAHRTMRKLSTPALLAVLGWLTSSLLVAGSAATAAMAAATLLFLLPGIPLTLRLLRYDWHHRWTAVVVGGLSGVVMSAAINTCVVWSAGWRPVVTAMAIALFSLALLMSLRAGGRGPRLGLDVVRGDAIALSAILLVLFIVLSIPLSRVGHELGDSRYYYSLFAHDYLMRGTYSIALLRGLPPRNIFLASHLGPNYYLFYSILAFAMDAAGQSITPHRFVAAADLVYSALFIITFYAVARTFLSRTASAALVTLASFLAYSFHGLYVIAKRIVIPPFRGLYGWLDAKGLFSFADVSHAWYRDFLVEPHAVFALTLLLALLILHAQTGPAQKQGFVRILSGVLLAGCFAADGFVGLLGMTWIGLLYLVELVQSDTKRDVLVRAALELAGFAACMIVFLASGMASVGGGSSYLVLKPYWTALKLGPVLFPLDLGPSVFLAPLGYLIWRKQPPANGQFVGVGRLGSLLLISLGFCLVVQHADSAHANLVYRKTLKVMQITLFLFSGIVVATLVEEGWQRHRWRLGATAALLALGLSAIGVDVAALSGYYDTGQTSAVTKADEAACDWLRMHTPRNSIVQSLPELPDQYYAVSPVAMLGGRAMALGNSKIASLSCSSADEMKRIYDEIDTLFRSPDLDETVAVLRKYNIDYVYIGSAENAYGGRNLDKYRGNDSVFAQAYSRDGVEIFEVAKGESNLVSAASKAGAVGR
jgi:hypothetical protein